MKLKFEELGDDDVVTRERQFKDDDYTIGGIGRALFRMMESYGVVQVVTVETAGGRMRWTRLPNTKKRYRLRSRLIVGSPFLEVDKETYLYCQSACEQSELPYCAVPRNFDRKGHEGVVDEVAV